MSYQVSQGDIFGRVGAGIGKGLADTVPQEIERYRLSQGLKDIAKNASAEPLQLMSQLLSTPGMTDQKAQMIMPYIQQHLQRQEANRRVQGQQNVGGTQASPTLQTGQPKPLTPSAQPNQVIQPGQKKGVASLVTPESQKSILKTWVEPSQDEKMARATKLSNENISTYPTWQDAMPYVEKEIGVERDNFRAEQQGFTNQSQLQQMADKEFNAHLSKQLQTNPESDFSEVWGPLQQQLKQRMYEDILDGVPLSEAADKYGKQALEIAKTMNNMKAKGSVYRHIRFGDDSKAVRNSFKNEYRNKFKEMGRLEDYSNILQSTQDMTPAYADSIAFPIENNPKINDLIKQNKENRLLESLRPATSGKKLRDLTDQIMENFTGDDSLLTIALELKRANYDENAFIDRVRSRYMNKLNQTQIHQLERSGTIKPSMGDVWLFNLMKPFSAGTAI